MDNTDRGHSPAALAAAAAAAPVDRKLRAFMIGVYNRVAAGLLVSAGLAHLTSSTPMVRDLLFKTAADGQTFVSLTPLGAFTVLSPILVMLAFGMRSGISAPRARLLYWSVVATIGASFGVLFLVYTTASIATAFAASAAGFGALSLYGYSTKRDLNARQSFWITGLIGLIVVMGVNLVLRSAAISFVLNAAGVVVFAGLIAWDTQRLKDFYHQNQHDTARMRASGDIGALSLYLDFINLFQFLLALTGSRR